MHFKDHSAIKGLHAFLSPSNYHWINYSDEKLDERYLTSQAARRGTELHEFASEAIRLGIKLPNTKATLNSYVNDAIGYRMTPEQPLFYSENCFGTADAISFSSKKNLLRIHDLKTGVTPASGKQLIVYAAIFCLEYGFRPFDISYDLRIYQNDEVMLVEIEPSDVAHVVDKIISFDKRIQMINERL